MFSKKFKHKSKLAHACRFHKRIQKNKYYRNFFCRNKPKGNKESICSHIIKISFSASKAVNACRFPTFDVTIPAYHMSHNVISQSNIRTKEHMQQLATLTNSVDYNSDNRKYSIRMCIFYLLCT